MEGILGTFSDGKIGIKNSYYSTYIQENPGSGANLNIIPDDATNIDFQNGIYQRTTSSGSLRFTFLKPNGSMTITVSGHKANNPTEALALARSQVQSRGSDWLFLGNTGGYTGPVGAGVYTGNAQENVDNTTDVPDASEPEIDDSILRNSDEFKALSEDQQQAVLSVYQAIAENNRDQAERIAAAFKTAAGISDPFFKQELRMAVDALERGFVSIDQEEEYQVRQLQQRQQDLEQDIQTQRDQLSFEEQAALRQINRQYQQDIKNVRQSMSVRGKTFSSERAETEGLVEEATGDLRESTTRRFGLEELKLDRTSQRSARDTQQELARLSELTKQKRLDLFREGESQVGTKNLPQLSGTEGIDPLGDIVGDIPQRQIADITAGAQNLIF